MATYVVINTLIALLALTIIKRQPATVKIRAGLVMVALSAWLIPYRLLASYFSFSPLTKELLAIPLSFNSSTTQTAIESVSIFSGFNLFGLFVVVNVIGIILFIQKIIVNRKWLNSVTSDTSHHLIQKLSDEHGIKIYSTIKLSSAALVGIVKPCIWISEHLVNSPHLNLSVCFGGIQLLSL